MVRGMVETAFLFPGQGSQCVDMGESILDDPRTAPLYDQASDVLGMDIRELILNGPAEKLDSTDNAQPVIFTDSLARYKILRDEAYEPDCVLGHSLGEFSALAAAGCYTFEQGIRIVKKRGELTSEVDVEGSMVAVMGIDYSAVEGVIAGMNDSVTVANHNSPRQVVISGREEELDESCEELRDKGAKCIKLDVTGPFHSSFMKNAEKELKSFIDRFEFSDPEVPVLSGVSGGFEEDGNRLKELLSRQMTQPVEWVDYVRFLGKSGIERTIEVGSDATLTQLTARILPDIDGLEFDEVI